MLNWFSVNAGHEPKYDPEKIAQAGFNGVHMVLQPSVSLQDYALRCHKAEIQLHGRIARESIAAMSPSQAALYYAHLYCSPTVIANGEGVDTLSVLNEADGDPATSPESWCLSPQEADVYLEAFLHGIREVNPDIPLYAVGTVTGQPSYIEKLNLNILRQYTALDIHTYAQSPNTVRDMMSNYDRFNMNYVVNEFGNPYPDPHQRGQYILEMMHSFERYSDILGAAVYCWDLEQSPPNFGVVDHGVYTPAVSYIQALGYPRIPFFTGAVAPPASTGGAFVPGNGFEKWARLEPNLIGSALGYQETNLGPGYQAQQTTKGTLLWMAGNGHTFVRKPDSKGIVKVYRWQEHWAKSQRAL